jgi:large subunit ribosomal protein L7/L12
LPFVWLIASILWILRIRSKVKKPKHFQQYVDDSISDNSTVRSLRAEIRILENEAANLKNSLVSVRVVGDTSIDYDDFDLILEDGGPKKIEVIKEIRALKGLDLKEAKDLVEAAPIEILSKVTENEAFAAKVILEEAGAMVTIRQST